MTRPSMSSTPEFAFAAVAAPHQAALAAGQSVLAQGGNALEAMVAMAAALAVVSPHRNGLGGDGLWMIREPGGKVRCIEAFGAAGSGATIRRYFKAGHEKTIPLRGPLAALTIPGAIAGWAQALEFSRARGGRLPLADLLRDAIRLAREGAPVSSCEARAMAQASGDLKEAPGFAAAFLPGGEAMKAGDLRRQETLAGVLDHLARAGLMDFYRGDVSREIAAGCERLGAPLTRDDLKRQDARWRDAYSVRLRGVTLYNAGPPSQGLASLLIPGLVERLEAGRIDSAQHVHGSIEAARFALALRDRECADFQWPTSDPERWLGADALEREAQALPLSRAGALAHRAHNDEGVWMGAVDPSGLVVSCVQSLGLAWGSGCVPPGVGVLMGNAGRAFSLDEKSVHALHPARRPFNALNAQIAAFTDGAVAACGASGGDADPQVTAQVFARVRAGMAPDAALAAPRFVLTQGEDGARVKLEEGFESPIVRALERAGHEVESVGPHADGLGRAGILHRAKNGRIRGAHDPRGEGGAAGL